MIQVESLAPVPSMPPVVPVIPPVVPVMPPVVPAMPSPIPSAPVFLNCSEPKKAKINSDAGDGVQPQNEPSTFPFPYLSSQPLPTNPYIPSQHFQHSHSGCYPVFPVETFGVHYDAFPQWIQFKLAIATSTELLIPRISHRTLNPK